MQTTLARRASTVQTAAFKKKTAPKKAAPAKRSSGGDAGLWLPNTTRPEWLGE